MKTSSGLKLSIYAGEWVDEVRRLGGLSAIPQPLPCRFTPKQTVPRMESKSVCLPFLAADSDMQQCWQETRSDCAEGQLDGMGFGN